MESNYRVIFQTCVSYWQWLDKKVITLHYKKRTAKKMRVEVIRNRVPSVFIATSSLLSNVKTERS